MTASNYTSLIEIFVHIAYTHVCFPLSAHSVYLMLLPVVDSLHHLQSTEAPGKVLQTVTVHQGEVSKIGLLTAL